MAKKRTLRFLSAIAAVVAIGVLASAIWTPGSGEVDPVGELTVSLEESGARSGQFAELTGVSFTPSLPNDKALILAHQFVRKGMNLADVEELPTRIASAKFSGQRHDNGEHAVNMNVRVVVFHDYPDWPRLPMGYSGPKPVDPRYTVVIDDHTRDVVFSVLTWGRENDAESAMSKASGASNPHGSSPQESVLALSSPSELPLDYPWSEEEQAQRDLAIEKRDASLLPKCTEDYFVWREATRERREAARGTEPPPGDIWAAPGCSGTPDRLVIGPPSGPGPVPTPTPSIVPGSAVGDSSSVHSHDLLPLCHEIERQAWPVGVPTPAPTAAPNHGSDGQAENVRCRATGTATDTPKPGRRSAGGAPVPSTDRPYYYATLDVDYDDSWVANIPSTIGGYEVRYISTPKSRACSAVPKISLQIPQDSTDSPTSLVGLHTLKKLLRSIPDVPHNLGLSFTPRRFDSDEKAANDADWNERRLKEGCIRLGGPIELKDDEGI